MSGFTRRSVLRGGVGLSAAASGVLPSPAVFAQGGKPYAGGLGIALISTSTGLLTERQAAKKGVGGEVLAYVW